MPKKLTVEEIRIELYEKRPDLIDKLEVVQYINSTNVIVKDKYGELKASFNKLIRGATPNIQSAFNKTNYFINKSKDMHGENISDYSEVVYKGSHHEVKLTCKNGHVFTQKPSDHFKGSGCHKCGGSKRYTKDEFIQEFMIRQPELSKEVQIVEYIGAHKIIAKTKYGKCLTNNRNLLNGSYPSILTALNRTEFFKKQVEEIHSDNYNLEYVTYVNSNTKVTLKCKHHGKFETTPRSILVNESGCPTCSRIIANAGYKSQIFDIEECRNIRCNFYILKFQNDDELFWKIGITRTKNNRIDSLRTNNYAVEVLYFKKSNLFDAVTLEQFLLKKYIKYRYNPKIRFGGYSECFHTNPLDSFQEVKVI